MKKIHRKDVKKIFVKFIDRILDFIIFFTDWLG